MKLIDIKLLRFNNYSLIPEDFLNTLTNHLKFKLITVLFRFMYCLELKNQPIFY